MEHKKESASVFFGKGLTVFSDGCAKVAGSYNGKSVRLGLLLIIVSFSTWLGQKVVRSIMASSVGRPVVYVASIGIIVLISCVSIASYLSTDAN